MFYYILLYCIVLHYSICSTIFVLLYVQSKAPEKGSSGQRQTIVTFLLGSQGLFLCSASRQFWGMSPEVFPRVEGTHHDVEVSRGDGGDMVLLSLKGDLRFRYSATTLDIQQKHGNVECPWVFLHSVETCWNIHRYAIYVYNLSILFSFVYVFLTLFLCVFMLFLTLLFVDYTWFSCQFASFSGRHFSSWPMTPWHLSERKMMMKKRRQKWRWLHPQRLT